MHPPSRSGAGEEGALQVLWEDGERVFCRTWREDAEGRRREFIAVSCAGEQPPPGAVERLTHEYGLKDHLDGGWALRPLDLAHERGRTILLMEPMRGESLARLIGRPMEVGRFLRLAVALSAALCPLHQRGLIHKDIKPANILVDVATDEIRLTGFGVASRLPRERQAPGPPEVIAGTLAYMAPEQTGRMNRSIDSRSDLYALGVTLYEMLTGSLPFAASDAMEWVHCHIARQAVAPGERTSGIPEALSSIVMKLLAKTPEERYQTAVGVEADLRHCLGEWRARGRIDPFPLGARDAPDRLLIAEELYGREREIDSLLACFDRVATLGAPELVLVSGYSGVGKSSLVNELHKALVPLRGLFAAGKFDQYKRDVPYATLAAAFQALIRQILVKSEAEVEQWRRDLTEALGALGRLMVNLVPELELIVGKQPAVPDLPPLEAQNRFQTLFGRFLGAFATREHALVLFLDDLQWLDAATLDLIEHLVTHGQAGRLLVIGAYRDNEVDPAHPLMRVLEAIKKTDATVSEIVLAPLGLEDIGRLVAGALRCDAGRARPLTELVYQKTGGNPFFATQFLSELAEEGLLEFHSLAQEWRWEIDRIHAKGYTDNVADLMVEKLKRLCPETQEGVKLLACLGHVAEIDALTLGYEETEEAMHATLREAVYAGLIDRQDGAYRFLHDRIRQAAYSLVPDGDRADLHLRIGRALLTGMTADQLAEHLFDVAGQLNRGAGQLIERPEKARVAAIDLSAGRKAKASAAYVSATAYLAAGMALLDERDWESRYELMFSLRLERAECEFLSGNFEEAEQLIADLLGHAASKADQAASYRLKILLHTLKSENAEAVDSGLECLRLFGVDIPAHPTQAQVQAEYEGVWRILDGRPIESLIDLPMMTDPEMLAATEVLSVLLSPAYHTDFDLWRLLACRMGKISMEHGASGASAHGYADLGQILGPVFRRYGEGYRFAELARDLVEKHGFGAYRAKVYHVMGVVAVWTQPIATAIQLLRTAFGAATESGDLAVACYCMDKSVTNYLMRNDPLDAVSRESEIGLSFARKARYHDVAAVIMSQQRFIAAMQGRTLAFSTFSDAEFDEAAFEAQITGEGTATAVCLYWILKLQARFLSGDYTEALASADRAKALLWAIPGEFQRLDYFYYAALTMAALYGNASEGDKQAWRGLLAAHREQLREWAETYPPTFADKHALASAEIARIEGRELDAERLYEEAIASARDHGFVQNEALAYETGARFYSARGFKTFANAYLGAARSCYLRWGAAGKVRDLERLHPHLREVPIQASPSATIGAPVDQLDVGAIIKASQALSGEVVPDRLLEILMTIALEQAGAERGLLILLDGAQPWIEAKAQTDENSVKVAIAREPVSAAEMPHAIFNRVMRTRQSVILHDASAPNSFSADPYLGLKRARSILCLPLIKQAALVGILHLENGLSSHVFTPNRVAVLEILVSQAAILLENTRLYSDLKEREAKIRRLVDANIMGIYIWDFDGVVLEANEAFLQMVECRREDLGSGAVRWTDLTPPEWRGRDEQALKTLKATGTSQPYEKEFLRKDGTRVAVLVGAAIFDGIKDQGVAFVVDLSDRKRAEDAERRYHEVHMELVHANRVATLGQLSASIAHEINQPLAEIIANASAGLRMLAADPPNIEDARETAQRTIRDGNRASEIIKRLRALFSKKDLTIESVDLNEAAREVIALTSSELRISGVIWRAELAPDLPLVRCDRVQLQQVILNLLRNALDSMGALDERPKRLTIRTATSAPDLVTLAVQDSGPGVDPTKLERIFDAFYSTKPGGLGMGLSVCRAIVEAHGGKLWATAGAPHGAVFQFKLPVSFDDGTDRNPFAVPGAETL